MHKIRNTKHLEILNSMLNIKPLGCSQPLSKKTMRKILIFCGWNKKKALEWIESGDYVYHFMDD